MNEEVRNNHPDFIDQIKTVRHEHFGMIGLKIGDRIMFQGNPQETLVVASGDGTPNNGGILVCYDDERYDGVLMSIRLITRKLLGLDSPLPEEYDVWKHWVYNGQTLREIFDQL